MNQDDVQAIIDRAVALSTKAALNGRPLERVYLMAPTSAADHWMGIFATKEYEERSAGDTPPWEL